MRSRTNAIIASFVALLLAAPAAFAAAGSLTPTINSVSPSVTFSASGLQTFAAFTIRWTNEGGNTVNNISATFTTSVVDANGANPYGYSAELYLDSNPLPQGCTKTSPTQFTCAIAQLKAGDSFPGTGAFTVFYKSPTEAAGDTTAALTYSVKLDASFVYAEGTNGNNPVGQPSTLGCADLPSICPAIGLGTNNPTFVRSAVPKSGIALFTGINAIPSPFAARVVIPALNSVFEKPASILLAVPESPSPTACVFSGQLATCRSASITVEEFSSTASTGHLEITLRFAASELTGRPVRPEQINVTYFKSETESYGNVNATLCPGFGTIYVAPRDDDRPCVARRAYYKNQSVPGYTPELAGVVELVFFVRQNGDWLSF